MGKVRLYKNPRFGKQKSRYKADPLVAHLPGVRAAVSKEANASFIRAAALLAATRDTGHSHVVRGRGKLDGYVTLVDPPTADGKHGNAMAIEGSRKILARAFGKKSFVDSPNYK